MTNTTGKILGCSTRSLLIIIAVFLLVDILAVAGLYAFLRLAGRGTQPTPTSSIAEKLLPSRSPTLTDVPTMVIPTIIKHTPTPGQVAVGPTHTRVVKEATPTPLLRATDKPSPPTPAPSSTPATPPVTGMLVLEDPTSNTLFSALAGAQPGQSVRVTLSESRLDAEIRRIIASQPNPAYQHQSVRFLNGKLVIAGQGKIENVSAPIEVTARLIPSNCRINVEIERMKFGPLPAPRFVVDQLSGNVHSWINAYLATFKFCVKETNIANSKLTIMGVIQ